MNEPLKVKELVEILVVVEPVVVELVVVRNGKTPSPGIETADDPLPAKEEPLTAFAEFKLDALTVALEEVDSTPLIPLSDARAERLLVMFWL